MQYDMFIISVPPPPLKTDSMSCTLSKTDEKHLIHKIKDGDKTAQERLLMAHLYLIMYLARKYIKYIQGSILSRTDLVSVGVIGFMDAVHKFDDTHDVRFATYAQKRVRGAIQDEIRSKKTTLHLSRPLQRTIQKTRKAQESLATALKRAPDIEELSSFSGESKETVTLALKSMSGDYLTLELEDVSFFSPHHDMNPEELLLQKERCNLLQKIIASYDLEKLPAHNQRNQLIFCQIHGLQGDVPHPLKKIGESMGISESRISQIDTKMKKWLKKKLEPFADQLLD